MTRVALYLRVSKANGSQTTDNQRPEVEALAASKGAVTVVYEEQCSAVKRRPAYEAMLEAARKGELDVLVIWAIDRFGRSMARNLSDLLELDKLGVRVYSVRESWLDTSGPVKPLLIAIFSWVAEQERARISERTKAGLARVRAHGQRLGRPKREFDVTRARALVGELGSVRAAAKAMGLPLATVQRGLA